MSQEAQEEAQKRRKREEALAKKKEREASEMEGVDADIQALMGFGGFSSTAGGGKKK